MASQKKFPNLTHFLAPFASLIFLVTAESVSVNFLIKIRETDQIKAEISIKIPPKLIEISGLKTTNVPKNPTSKAITLLFFNFSYKKKKANKVVKIGTVKLRAVT